ncbi:MAG: hypothetical protein CMJ48_03260 [Planctomycetaceae bacterium]|nr:hypothetical protein [Planctomycetaceae bacterium]
MGAGYGLVGFEGTSGDLSELFPAEVSQRRMKPDAIGKTFNAIKLAIQSCRPEQATRSSGNFECVSTTLLYYKPERSLTSSQRSATNGSGFNTFER